MPKSIKKRIVRPPTPARKVALTRRGRRSLSDAARSFVPLRRGTKTWADHLQARDATGYAELVAMARDFNTGGEWRDHFITVGNFHRFVVAEFGPVCKHKAFSDWLQTIGGDA